jgi:hypothetical protein
MITEIITIIESDVTPVHDPLAREGITAGSSGRPKSSELEYRADAHIRTPL